MEQVSGAAGFWRAAGAIGASRGLALCARSRGRRRLGRGCGGGRRSGLVRGLGRVDLDVEALVGIDDHAGNPRRAQRVHIVAMLQKELATPERVEEPHALDGMNPHAGADLILLNLL
jgi:hypothetical protein